MDLACTRIEWVYEKSDNQYNTDIITTGIKSMRIRLNKIPFIKRQWKLPVPTELITSIGSGRVPDTRCIDGGSVPDAMKTK